MARTDNLTNFLTDVSTAIKEKKGDNTPIKASNFDTEITNLPSGGDMSAYFDVAPQEITNIGTTKYSGYWTRMVKKIPPIEYLPSYCYEAFSDFKGDTIDFSQISSDTKPTVMSRMFYRHEAPKVDISYIDCSQVQNLSNTFNYCVCDEYNLGEHTFSKCTNFDYTFANSNIKSSDISKIDFSNANTQAAMLYSCPNITGDLVLSNLYANTYSSMCYKCTNLNSLKMSSAKYMSAHSNRNLSSLVKGCTNLKTLDLSEFGLFLKGIKGNGNQATLQDFVRDCTSLENLIFGEGYGTAFVTATSANNNYSKIDLSTCTSLTKASVLDVFNKVADISAKNTQQIILPPNMMEQLTEEEIAIATNKGWTVS